MHFPEFTLNPGGFRDAGRDEGVVVHLQRKIAEQDADFSGILTFQFRQPTRDGFTGRTLKIAEFFDRHRRLRVAANVRRFGSRLLTEVAFDGTALSSAFFAR